MLLLRKMQLVNVGEALMLLIPLPRYAAELRVNKQLVRVGEPSSMYIPPPRRRSCGPLQSPLAFPSVTVKPSRTAVASTWPAVTTW